tara:strand:+ start:76036 stop:76239 length:204 start_codon:yes stop_codon:yes gene_type:complete
MEIKTIKPTTSDIYYIVYSDDFDFSDSGVLSVGNELTTGQPNVEEFTTELEMKVRLAELENQKTTKL